MKFSKSLVAAAFAVAFAGSAFATSGGGQPAPSVGSSVAVVGGVASVNSSSSAVAASTGTGSASVQASNQGQAYVASGASAAVDRDSSTATTGYNPTGIAAFVGYDGSVTKTTTTTNSGSVEVSGVAQTRNISTVVTSSNGDALAVGGAGGLAVAAVGGAGSFNTAGTPNGNAIGAAGAVTGTGVASVGNGSNQQNGGTLSSFSAGASADSKDVVTQNGAQLTYFGPFVPTGQPSSSSLVNDATFANASSNSNMGYTVNTPVANTGTSVGGTLNGGVAGANANASATGTAAAAALDL